MFTWPTPPFATYPRAVEQQASEACEIVGLNGKRMQGRLIFFVPDEGIAHVQVPPARTTTALRFSQFKSLRVLPPLAPRQRPAASAPARGGDPQAAVLEQRPRTRYRVTLGAGGEMRGETIGHVETAHGLFLFPPLADDDSVQRLFVPREAYRRRAVRRTHRRPAAAEHDGDAAADRARRRAAAGDARSSASATSSSRASC